MQATLYLATPCPNCGNRVHSIVAVPVTPPHHASEGLDLTLSCYTCMQQRQAFISLSDFEKVK